METVDFQQYRRFLEISNTLNSSQDLEELLRTVVSNAAEITRTEVASILIADRFSGRIHIAASTDSQIKQETSIPLEGTAAAWIIKESCQLIIGQEDDRRFDDLTAWSAAPYRDMLGVPLITKDKAFGVLEVMNKPVGEEFNEQDVFLMQSLASQAAMAIENARLFQQTDIFSEFMHEIKTPLMAITAASELLARDDLTSKAFELVDMIQNETKRLAKMAQDFLDLARLESGRVNIEHEPVNVNLLVQDVLRIQEPQANSQSISIETDLPEQQAFIAGDYDRLKQMLLNLTSNAIKYNDVGGNVTIRVEVEKDEIVIAVSDTGSGIAKENLPHLFERFYRIPDSEGFTKGTGLGLSISARIIEEHGGRIEVESELGKGSIFRCRLPRQ